MSRPIGMRKVLVTVATAGTAVQISSSEIMTPFIEVYVPSGNTGAVYIGDLTVDSTWIPRSAGSIYRFSASERGDVTKGDYFDLSLVYIDAANSADTAIVQYLLADK